MKQMPISYMTSNGNAYYLQKRIPKDLLLQYPDNPSGIIKRYLSADRKEAARKLPIELARLEEEFAATRQLEGSAVALSDKHIERLTAIWLSDLLVEDEEDRLNSDEEGYAELYDYFVRAGFPASGKATPSMPGT